MGAGQGALDLEAHASPSGGRSGTARTRQVYTAATEAVAKERFTEFTDKWGAPYPAIIRDALLAEAEAYAVIAGVHNKLVQLYSGHARANHKKLADQFDAAAKEFAAAAAIVDPERHATAMVDEDEARRSAWLSAPLVAARLGRVSQ